MPRLRIAGRLALLLLILLVHLPLHGLWRLVGARSPWSVRFLGAAAWACGVRLTRHGHTPRRDVLVVANHISWLDILILGGATRAAFVSKAELASAPLVGWLAGLNRTIYIKREDRRAIPAQVAAIRTALHDGPVAIFPEGTTGDARSLLPFKPALLQVLDRAAPDLPPHGLSVQPVVVDYGAAATEIAWVEEDGASNALRVLARRGTIRVTLHCLAPFDPATVGDRKALATETRNRIAAVLERSRTGMAGA